MPAGKDLPPLEPDLALCRRLQDAVTLYLTAWRGAQKQNNSFLHPTPIFAKIKTGCELNGEMSTFTALVFQLERLRKSTSLACSEMDLLTLRECYVSMRKEARIMSQIERELDREAPGSKWKELLEDAERNGFSQNPTCLQLRLRFGYAEQRDDAAHPAGAVAGAARTVQIPTKNLTQAPSLFVTKPIGYLHSDGCFSLTGSAKSFDEEKLSLLRTVRADLTRQKSVRRSSMVIVAPSLENTEERCCGLPPRLCRRKSDDLITEKKTAFAKIRNSMKSNSLRTMQSLDSEGSVPHRHTGDPPVPWVPGSPMYLWARSDRSVTQNPTVMRQAWNRYHQKQKFIDCVKHRNRAVMNVPKALETAAMKDRKIPRWQRSLSLQLTVELTGEFTHSGARRRRPSVGRVTRFASSVTERRILIDGDGQQEGEISLCTSMRNTSSGGSPLSTDDDRECPSSEESNEQTTIRQSSATAG